MFLKAKASLIIVISFLSLTTFAQSLIGMAAGDYILESGPEHLCRNFTVAPEDLNSKHLSIGGQYSFQTLNSVHDIESDIDPACEFKERNQREIVEEQTVLTRINEEVCRGKLRSKTLSVATISTGQITLRHEVGNAPAYTCVWKVK